MKNNYPAASASILLCILLLVCLLPAAVYAQFDADSMKFRGSPAAQAAMLLRNVKQGGQPEKAPAVLDNALLQLIGTAVHLDTAAFGKYLSLNHIGANAIGGAINKPLSFITLHGQKIVARYFVIHDVSSPEFENTFPANINEASWEWNNINKWKKKVTHVYLTRTGQSNTVADFGTGLRATKLELVTLKEKSRGLFLHVELVQPRVYPPGKVGSAMRAPDPGFTELQYKRLALLYIAASIRKGEWLIPAFHACVDDKIKGAHDDPQRFEMSKWVAALQNIIKEITLL